MGPYGYGLWAMGYGLRTRIYRPSANNKPTTNPTRPTRLYSTILLLLLLLLLLLHAQLVSHALGLAGAGTGAESGTRAHIAQFPRRAGTVNERTPEALSSANGQRPTGPTVQLLSATADTVLMIARVSRLKLMPRA